MNARRRDRNIFEDLHEMFVEMPVWAGPIAAGIAYAIFRWWFPWMLKPSPTAEKNLIVSPLNFGEVFSSIAHWVALAVLAVWAVALLDKLIQSKKGKNSKRDRN